MSKIRQSARGEVCQARIPNICNHDSSTVVLAHANGAGMGMKDLDFIGAYVCSACHDVIDGRVRPVEYERFEIDFMFFEAIFRTQRILFKKGLLRVD